MKAEEKHQISEWLKKQDTELKITPSHYFDLIELIHNYHIEQLKLAKVTPMTRVGKSKRSVIYQPNVDNTTKPPKNKL